MERKANSNHVLLSRRERKKIFEWLAEGIINAIRKWITAVKIISSV
jgi:hypothetical protein